MTPADIIYRVRKGSHFRTRWVGLSIFHPTSHISFSPYKKTVCGMLLPPSAFRRHSVQVTVVCTRCTGAETIKPYLEGGAAGS